MTAHTSLDDAIPTIVVETWDNVMKVSDGIVKAHAKFGFSNIEKHIDPSLEDILTALRVVRAMMKTVNGLVELDIAEQRLVDNALQQILHVECISMALKNKDLDAYNLHVTRLESQPRI